MVLSGSSHTLQLPDLSKQGYPFGMPNNLEVLLRLTPSHSHQWLQVKLMVVQRFRTRYLGLPVVSFELFKEKVDLPSIICLSCRYIQWASFKMNLVSSLNIFTTLRWHDIEMARPTNSKQIFCPC